MTKEELIARKKIIDDNRKTQLNELYREYAFSNNKIKLGDIITDHMGSIKVEYLGVYLISETESACTYTGTQYTKKLNPFKNGEKRKVYQQNLI